MDEDFSVVVITGGVGLEPSLHLSDTARRAGALTVLDLGNGDPWALRTLNASTGLLGVRVTSECTGCAPDDLRRGIQGGTVILTADAPWSVADVAADHRVLVEVTSLAEAHAAIGDGAAGLIGRGMESGGRVSDLSSYVLFQQLMADPAVTVPVWVAGGIGPRTAAACRIGGAAGVVLDSQLALMPEALTPDGVAAAVRRMDGTAAAGPIGSDGALAVDFARRWPDTATAVRAIRSAMDGAAEDREAVELLGPGSPMAESLGVRLPVAQGPMTRVSDEAGFAEAVAAGGGLPFIALALSTPEHSRRILTATAEALGERPWGVGVLGFAAEELRNAQLEVVREVKPAVAIIAGGRPAQARQLEDEGVKTFLHVPSPGLLRQFLKAGSRRFIFEGAECGGHVGPRSSFLLWEAQLAVLEELAGEDVEVFFAGGIHDERSAAMVAVMAAPLARRGVKVGLLMGTAYLFTDEAVEHGAIQAHFRDRAIGADRTVLLETAPGHATRCLDSGFTEDFYAVREDLEAAGVDKRIIWEQMELLNTGRGRIASKGLSRQGGELVRVTEATQAAEGMFMAGQVAVLRDRATTIAELHEQVSTGAARLLESCLREVEPEILKARAPLDIAIVGMACAYPGSPDLGSFWRTIVSGKDAVTEVPAHRWDVETYYRPELGPGQAGRVSVSKWGGFLDPMQFDAIGYGVPPASLPGMDPSQLWALEISRRALVDAGYATGADHSATGVIFGAETGTDMASTHAVRMMLPAYFGDVPAAMEDVLPKITEDTFPGLLPNVIAGRVANRLDLGGPNFTVDAACASSLAALDVACKELISGNSDLMLCGAADLHNGVADYLMFTSARALSPTGRSRTFDSAGDGIAIGEGVACVVLKRLADAERDGDRVYAVIKGIGGASDGRALGLTAPRPAGQRRALDRAYAIAGISPAEVGLVEAHGTGTVVGDRVELETLTTLFAESGATPGGTALGSVKSQIGHTKCAAGLAGVIKAAMAVHTATLPPTIHLTKPNPAWDPVTSPFAFHTSAAPWAGPAADRVAGVSAFGFGGTNFHTVLAAHAGTGTPRHGTPDWPAELFLFRSDESARRLLERIPADARLRDLAVQAARASDPRTGPVRIGIVARNVDDLKDLLRRALAGEHDPRAGLVQPGAAEPGKVAFLFPGQGSQRTGALADLFVAFPELGRYLELGREWAGTMYPPAAFDPATEQAQRDRIRDTRAAQPVLGVGGLAVDHLLRRFGVRPDMAAGHSYGELVALCVAGAFPPETLLALSRERADAILAAAGDDPGTMAAVTGTADRVRSLVGADVVIANHNAPEQVVISGPTDAVTRASAALKDAGLSARRIPVACAFHSPVVAAGASAFATALEARDVSAPRIPVWSNQTAEAYPDDPNAVRATLAGQIASPVRFVDQIENMYEAGARVFIEAGPGRILSGLVPAILGDRPHTVVTCDGPAGLPDLLRAVAELACAGVPVQTGWMFQGREDRVPPAVTGRPTWTIDGQSVRDRNGERLPGSMAPPRRLKELTMTSLHLPPTAIPTPEPAGTAVTTLPVTAAQVTAAPATYAATDGHTALMAEYLRTNREMLTTQRDVLLAFLGNSNGNGHTTTERVRYAHETAIAPSFAPAIASPAPAVEEVVLAAPPVDVAPAVASAPPAHATPVPVPASLVPVASPADGVDVPGLIVSLISERTGYPEELIEPDLDLEADLGVDSIKRAEIAGEVADRLGLSVDGDESELEDLVKARTVSSMVAWIAGRADEPIGPETTASDPAVAVAAPVGVAPERLVAESAPAGRSGPALEIFGARFRVAGGDSAVRTGVVGALTRAGAAVTEGGGVGDHDGVILLDPLTPGADSLLPGAFAGIREELVAGPRWLLAAGRPAGNPRDDGLAGLFRTIAVEYPDVRARYLRLPEGADVAADILAELRETAPSGVVDRVLGDRRIHRLVPMPLGPLATRGAGPAADGVAETTALGLTPESVVLLIGGARGVTTWFARALAGAARCRVELAGRTPIGGEPEAPDTLTAADQAALRGVLARRGGMSPAEIDRESRAILAAREVTTTMTELAELGADVRYHQVDVRDTDAVRDLIKRVHDEYGRVDGVVYAAGVIEDRLLAEKEPASFARVFGTKVGGAHAVLGALTDTGAAPGFTVLFGSIAAFGSRGQCDYAAANDALEQIGTRWAAETGRRCLTVHWGPWAPVGAHAGMVSPQLADQYARRGVSMIDPEQGAMSLLRELAWGDPATTAVVYAGGGW